MAVDPQVRAFYEAKLKNNSGSNNSGSNSSNGSSNGSNNSGSLRSEEPSDEEQQQKDLELVAALRKNADRAYNDSSRYPEVFETMDIDIPCIWGSLPVRVYKPGDKEKYPVLVYYHGGGFIIHNIASHDSLCRKLCLECNAVVVSVGYRLAPEAKWTEMFEDCYGALEWVRDNAGGFCGDPERLAVGGDSAGAMLSASVALYARDRRGPGIGLQILAYGTACDLGEDESASMRELIDNNYVLNREFLALCYRCAGQNDDLKDNIYVYPGKCRDLTGMPKTLSLNAEYDPLRDDGEEYARRLKAAGNDVVSWRVPGMMHGFLLLWDKFDMSEHVIRETGKFFRETFSC